MAAHTLVGTATCFGLDNSTIAMTGVAATDNEPQSVRLSHSFDKQVLRNKGGRVVAEAGYSDVQQLEVEVTWQDPGGSPTEASARGKVYQPTRFQVVTLALFSNALLNGTWNYIGGTPVQAANEAFWRSTWTLQRRVGSDGTTFAAQTAVTAGTAT